MQTVTVQEIAERINEWAPWDTAEPWDNCGVIVNMGQTVTGVLCALDITHEVIDEAKAYGCNVIFAHHPVIFKPVKCLSEQEVFVRLAREGISAVCAHTNLDKAENGVSHTLAECVGLSDISCAEGFLYTGVLPQEMKMAEFAAKAGQCLGASVQYTCAEKIVKRIAVVSGAGGDFFREAAAAGCDCLLTGEASHHEALDAQQMGLALAAAGHCETEYPVVAVMAEKLRGWFSQLKVEKAERNSPFCLFAESIPRP